MWAAGRSSDMSRLLLDQDAFERWGFLIRSLFFPFLLVARANARFRQFVSTSRRSPYSRIVCRVEYSTARSKYFYYRKSHLVSSWTGPSTYDTPSILEMHIYPALMLHFTPIIIFVLPPVSASIKYLSMPCRLASASMPRRLAASLARLLDG